MIRSSRGVRLESFFASTSTPSSSRSASSSSVNLATRSLSLHAGEEGHTLGHALLPGIWRRDRRQPTALLLEFQGSLGEVPCLLDCEVDALGGDYGGNLLQALLAHGLGENGISLAERIDAINQVDVEVSYAQRKFADAIDEGSVQAFLAVVPGSAGS